MHDFIREQYAFITEAISDGMITLGVDGKIKTLNSAAEQLTHWSAADLCGKPLPNTAFLDSLEISDVYFPFSKCIFHSGDGGKTQYLELKGDVIHDKDGKPLEYILLLTEVSDAKVSADVALEERDALTGAYNRKYFTKEITRLLESNATEHTPHGLIYLDLDQFKVINDTCGEDDGDLLLQRIASVISDAIRGTDTFCRVGGDEFAVILPGCQPMHACSVATKIVETISQNAFDINGKKHHVTVSTGLLNIQGQYADVSEVFRDANIACTLASQEGKNRVYQLLHTQKDVISYKSKLNWFSRINHALEAGQFLLYFQSIAPLMDDEEKIHGEVLIRLLDDDGSVISPSEFMPSVEHFQLASKIDTYIIDRAFDFLDNQQAAIDEISMVSINLSGQSVNDSSFRKYLYAKVFNARFDVSKVCFEITETIALDNLKDTIPFIKKLKELGVKFALDDFGSGASSFSYLKKLPVDFLKIDGQFIVNFDQEQISQLTVDCLTKIAKISGAKTIAEWVETSEVYHALKEVNVDYIQGYYHHKPEPMDTFFSSNASVAKLA